MPNQPTIDNNVPLQNPTPTDKPSNSSLLSEKWVLLTILLIVISVSVYYFVAIKPFSKKTIVPAQPQTILTETEIEQSINSIPPLEQEGLLEFSETIRPVVTEGADLMLGSAKKTYAVGDAVDITLLLNSKVVPDGVEFEISYNPQKLTQVKLTAINNFGTFLAYKVHEDTGKIVGMLIREPGEEVSTTQALPLLKISGQAQQAGSMTLNFNPEKTSVAAAGGQEVLENAYNLMIEIE